jgi:hypothetical protein
MRALRVEAFSTASDSPDRADHDSPILYGFRLFPISTTTSPSSTVTPVKPSPNWSTRPPGRKSIACCVTSVPKGKFMSNLAS